MRVLNVYELTGMVNSARSFGHHFRQLRTAPRPEGDTTAKVPRVPKGQEAVQKIIYRIDS